MYGKDLARREVDSFAGLSLLRQMWPTQAFEPGDSFRNEYGVKYAAVLLVCTSSLL